VFLLLKIFYVPPPKVAAYLKFTGEVNVQVNSEVRFKIYNRNNTVPSLIFWHGLKGYEFQSLSIWSKLCQQSSVILDIGANFGLFGIVAQAMNKASNVYLFEPLERNVERIRHNLKLNRFSSRAIQSS
jgi:ribosomal protein L11 methylase PrmA